MIMIKQKKKHFKGSFLHVLGLVKVHYFEYKIDVRTPWNECFLCNNYNTITVVLTP